MSTIVCILLINVKMPTSSAILTFMSMMNFILSSVEHEKKFSMLSLQLVNDKAKDSIGIK